MQRITLKASWLTGVAYTCNPSSIKKWEETGKGVQGHIQPYSKFEVSLGYTGVYVCVSVCVHACTCAWCVHKKLKKRRRKKNKRKKRKKGVPLRFLPMCHVLASMESIKLTLSLKDQKKLDNHSSQKPDTCGINNPTTIVILHQPGVFMCLKPQHNYLKIPTIAARKNGSGR